MLHINLSENTETTASKRHTLFEPQPLDSGVKKLLQHSAKGEAKEAEELAKLNPHFILSKASFNEEWCGQRKWKAISPLQYPAWAGDSELVDSFLKQLTLEAKPEALRQLKEIKEKGTEHGKHLSVVYRLMDQYIEFERQYHFLSSQQRGAFWVQMIGKNLLHSVVNLIQWYCSPTPFSPLLDFNQALARSLNTWQGVLLDLSIHSPLGLSSTLYKGGGPDGLAALWTPEIGVGGLRLARWDCAAISRFCEERVRNLDKQIAGLESELGIQKQQEVVKESQCCLVM